MRTTRCLDGYLGTAVLALALALLSPPGATAAEILVKAGFDNGAVSVADPDERYLEIEVVVLDKSGSMAEARKIDFVRKAAHQFVDSLQPGDRFALVTYDDRVGVPIPSEAFEDRRRAQRIPDMLAREFSALQNVYAADVELTIEVHAEVVIHEILGYRFRRDGNRYVVSIGSLAAGERRRVMCRVAPPRWARGGLPGQRLAAEGGDAGGQGGRRGREEGAPREQGEARCVGGPEGHQVPLVQDAATEVAAKERSDGCRMSQRRVPSRAK